MVGGLAAPRESFKAKRSGRTDECGVPSAIAPLLLGLLAAGIASFEVWRPAIWRDEAASIAAAERNWSAFAGLIAHVDAVHAIYYALLHLWFDLVPYDPLTLRLPSVVATGGTAAILTLLGRRLAGRGAGLAAGAASAVLPSLMWAGGEGRSYALTAFLASAATLALVHALGNHVDRRRAFIAWAGYAALVALTVAVFLDAALLVPAHLVTIVFLGQRPQRRAGVVALTAAVVVVLPLLVVAAGQTAQVSWIVQYGSPPLIPTGVKEQWFRSNSIFVAWAVVLTSGLAFAVARRRVPRNALVVALPWAVLPSLVLTGIGLVHEPLYWPRYVTFTAPAVALLAGAVAARLPRPLPLVALAVLAVVAIPQLEADRQPRAKADSEMRLAADLVSSARSRADGPSGIIHSQYDDAPGWTTRLEAVAYPWAFRGLTDLRATTPLNRSTELFGSDLSPSAASAKAARLHTVWVLLDTDSRPSTRVPSTGLRALGFHPSGVFEAPGTVLLRFTR